LAKKVATGILIIVILPFLIWLVHKKPGPPSISYPPYDLTAILTPYDTTGSVTLSWFVQEGDEEGAPSFPDYKILRSEYQEGPFEEIGTVSFDVPRST
jgi:hypothetical protein